MTLRGSIFLAGWMIANAQEATSSFEIPVTLTGGSMFTRRLQSGDPMQAPYSFGFRAVISPTLRLGPHWFFYSALQINSTPYFYYDAYAADEKGVDFHALQAFVGYSTTVKKASLLIKAGQLSSAFGSFPLQYDDAKNPLIDQPLSYSSRIPLRPDQLPCGVNDLLSQEYNSDISHQCGGPDKERYGLLPATVYGLIGLEAELSAGRMDARLQITSSSPANPQGLTSHSQSAQWSAGGGYTIRTGLRIGVSAFRGPYLDRALEPLFPSGKTVRDFSATAIGGDVQWSRGRWALNGELQRFQFDSPNFQVAPAVNVAYADVKTILSTRTFVAVRAGLDAFSKVRDVSGVSASHWADSHQVYEIAIGFRPNRHQLIKAGYEWVHGGEVSGTHDNVVGIQLVTTFTALPLVLR
jgi:hypothetical protein